MGVKKCGCDTKEEEKEVCEECGKPCCECDCGGGEEEKEG